MSLTPATVRRLLRETADLQKNPPEGVRLAKGQGNDEEFTRVVAIVAGPPGTPFEGGYFKIRFTFGDDYPASPPKAIFQTKIFHPNVEPTKGEICVSALKKDWVPTSTISHILLIIKCLLIHPNPASALHAEAGRLLLEAFDDYASRARLMTSIHATPSSPPAEFAPPPAMAKTPAIPLHESSFSNTTSSFAPMELSQSSTGGKKRAADVEFEAPKTEPMALKAEPSKMVKKRGLKRL